MESVQVEIFGQTYSIKAVNGRKYIEELAELVDVRMREIAKGTGSSDGFRIAILAALNIADELQRLRSQHDVLSRTAATSLDHLIELTDEALKK